jgi:two-component system cell cycle sensor histidine kinase/response regulator CckA
LIRDVVTSPVSSNVMKSDRVLRVLHLEDNHLDAELVQAAIESEGYRCDVSRVDDRASFVDALNRGPYDLILADYTLPAFDGVSALSIVQQEIPDTPFIFVSGTIGEDLAIDCLKGGATDYILKHRLGRLGPSIRRALVEAEERRERREAEEAIRNQAQLLDLANDSIIVRDLEDRITYWNQGAERLFGWTESDALGRFEYELLQTVFTRSAEEIRHAFVRDGHWEGELVQKKRDGSIITVESRWTLQRNTDGSPHATLEISNDVTQRRRLEAQFLQAQKMESVGRLASGVAHDFNNLLTVIIGRSYLLMSRVDDDRMRKDLDLVQKTAERAAVLTRQLLAFSRRQPIIPRLLDLNELVANMDKMLRRLIGEDIDVLSEFAPNLGKVKADPGQMEQVIMNLAVNARDAMPKGGKLTIETANIDLDSGYASHHLSVAPGKYIMLAISDTGCGMDAETQNHIFEPFFTTKDSGTGLGLSTVYGIVKQSGGNIWVYSELGVGTTFKVYLPRASDSTEPGQVAAEGSQISGGSETILLVEDEQAVREIVRETLTSQGYTVLEAQHGPEALRIAEKHTSRIHLLMTDVVMPAMHGPELADALCKIHSETKVLFMSGYTDSALTRHGVLEGKREFMQKPFTLGDLAKRVRGILDLK